MIQTDIALKKLNDIKDIAMCLSKELVDGKLLEGNKITLAYLRCISIRHKLDGIADFIDSIIQEDMNGQY